MKKYLLNYLGLKWPRMVLFIFLNSTEFLIAQNPNCDLYGATYNIGVSYTDCECAY